MAYQVEKFLGEAQEKTTANPAHALAEEDKTKLQGLADEAKRLKEDDNASKEDMDKVMQEIESTLNALYQKYGGQWNSNAAAENPGEQIIEADETTTEQPTDQK